MSSASSFDFSHAGDEPVGHIYSLCFFQSDDVVPAVELIEATDDKDAIVIAHSKRPWLVREIWERHRFVARLKCVS